MTYTTENLDMKIQLIVDPLFLAGKAYSFISYKMKMNKQRGLLWNSMIQYDEPPSPCNTEPTPLPRQPSCRILPDANWPLFQLTFFGLSYVVPLTLICGLYLLMLIRLWKGTRSTSVGSRRGRKRVTRLVLVVVGVFALCWLPIQVSYNVSRWTIICFRQRSSIQYCAIENLFFFLS